MVIVECGLALSGLRLHQDQQGPRDRARGGAARAAPRLRVPAVRQGVHHAQHVPPAPAGPQELLLQKHSAIFHLVTHCI